MTDIEWRIVFSNAPWILGCAIALAVLSYTDWRAAQHHEKLRAQFGRPNIRMAFDIAFVLICLGLAASADSTFAVIIWLILTILASLRTTQDWLAFRRASRTQP